MNTNLEKIAAAFITDMANKYALPELLSARRLPISESEQMSKRYTDDGMFATVDVQPSGQLSAIVRSLSVTVIVQADTFVKHLYHGTIKFSYDHHSGGSNGSSTNLVIAVERSFGSVETYLGALENNAFAAVRQHLHYYEQDQKKSNDS